MGDAVDRNQPHMKNADYVIPFRFSLLGAVLTPFIPTFCRCLLSSNDAAVNQMAGKCYNAQLCNPLNVGTMNNGKY